MSKLIIGLIGLLLGGVLTYFVFVGAPRSSSVPGNPVLPPDAAGTPPGTVQLVLRQEFFNEVLGTIFRDMEPPVFALTEGSQNNVPPAQGGCASQITVLREGSGVQTGVRFENNNLQAPMAFTGAYESMFGCLQFSGWAQTRMDLRFDQANQTVFGQVNVETVNLDGVNPVFSALITPIVQGTLNSNVNPVRIIDGRQLAVDLPIAASKASLQAGVSDVRAEVKENTLNLYVTYGFRGARTNAQP
jgi:hypothetical protein